MVKSRLVIELSYMDLGTLMTITTSILSNHDLLDLGERVC